jgi:hypothetical protein
VDFTAKKLFPYKWRRRNWVFGNENSKEVETMANVYNTKTGVCTTWGDRWCIANGVVSRVLSGSQNPQSSDDSCREIEYALRFYFGRKAEMAYAPSSRRTTTCAHESGGTKGLKV